MPASNSPGMARKSPFRTGISRAATASAASRRKASARARKTKTTGNKDAIGGQVYAVGTVEMTFPLGLPEEFGLEGSVFSDFGTVFDAPEKTTTVNDCAAGCAPDPAPCTYKVFDTAALRASVGAGVIWQSPFGPLRVDLAYPFAKADYDKTEYFRFSFGSRF